MNIKDNLPKYVVLAFFVGAIGLWFAQSNNPRAVAGIPVAVKLPQLSAQAEAGKKAFASNCAQCHGANGAGTDKGPPLIHDIYNPGHHADEAFFMAAKFGVRQHHWNSETCRRYRRRRRTTSPRSFATFANFKWRMASPTDNIGCSVQSDSQSTARLVELSCARKFSRHATKHSSDVRDRRDHYSCW